MTKENTFQKFLFSLLIGAGVVLLGIQEPTVFYLGAAVIGFIGISWGISCAFVAAGPCVLGLVLANAGNLLYIVCSLVLLLFTAVILIVGLKKRMPYRTVAALLALVLIITLYIVLCVPSILRGEAPYAGVKDYFIELDELLKSAFGIEETSIAIYAENIDVMLYPMIIIISEMLAFLAVLICKKLCTWAKADVRPMAKLADWEIPSSLRIGIPVLAGGCLIIYLTGYRGIEGIIASVVGLIAPILFIEGIAATVFLFTGSSMSVPSAKKKKTGLIVAAVILFAVFIPMAFILMGAIELYSKRRPKLRILNEKVRRAFEYAEKNNLDVVQVDLGDGKGLRIIATRKQKVGDEAFFDDDIRKNIAEGNKTDMNSENNPENMSQDMSEDMSENTVTDTKGVTDDGKSEGKNASVRSDEDDKRQEDK